MIGGEAGIEKAIVGPPVITIGLQNNAGILAGVGDRVTRVPDDEVGQGETSVDLLVCLTDRRSETRRGVKLLPVLVYPATIQCQMLHPRHVCRKGVPPQSNSYSLCFVFKREYLVLEMRGMSPLVLPWLLESP